MTTVTQDRIHEYRTQAENVSELTRQAWWSAHTVENMPQLFGDAYPVASQQMDDLFTSAETLLAADDDAEVERLYWLMSQAVENTDPIFEVLAIAELDEPCPADRRWLADELRAIKRIGGVK